MMEDQVFNTNKDKDSFLRARANLKKIRKERGNIDVLELLDEVRGLWKVSDDSSDKHQQLGCFVPQGETTKTCTENEV